MFPIKLQVLWEGQDVRSLWLSSTDPGCPVLGWGFLSKGLGWGVCSWDSASPVSSFLLPAPSCQPPHSSPCPAWPGMKNGAEELAEASLRLLGRFPSDFPPAQPLLAWGE